LFLVEFLIEIKVIRKEDREEIAFRREEEEFISSSADQESEAKEAKLGDYPFQRFI
jgi:hypothetical protein